MCSYWTSCRETGRCLRAHVRSLSTLSKQWRTTVCWGTRLWQALCPTFSSIQQTGEVLLSLGHLATSGNKRVLLFMTLVWVASDNSRALPAYPFGEHPVSSLIVSDSCIYFSSLFCLLRLMGFVRQIISRYSLVLTFLNCVRKFHIHWCPIFNVPNEIA